MQTFIPDETIHFRLRYRNEIRFLIADIVKSMIPPDQAEKKVNDNAQRLPKGDQERFIETINILLSSLHEGNCVCYWIRPLEFERWKAVWSSKN